MPKRHSPTFDLPSFDLPSGWGDQLQAVSAAMSSNFGRGLRATGKAADATRTHASRVIGTTALAFGLTAGTVGCTSMPSRQQMGVVGGAVVGGAIGAAATQSKTGTVVGAAAGAWVGNELTKPGSKRK